MRSTKMEQLGLMDLRYQPIIPKYFSVGRHFFYKPDT